MATATEQIKTSVADSTGDIPTTKELHQILVDMIVQSSVAKKSSFSTWGSGPVGQYNTVYPGVILGGASLAKDLKDLKANKVTHILNCAQGKQFAQIDTDAEYYHDMNITFLGIPAKDIAGFKLNEYFTQAADFMEHCLQQEKGCAYVHCFQGISRSATLVIAFLMIKRNMRLRDALILVKNCRNIFPNEGFLKQLCQLDKDLQATKEH